MQKQKPAYLEKKPEEASLNTVDDIHKGTRLCSVVSGHLASSIRRTLQKRICICGPRIANVSYCISDITRF